MPDESIGILQPAYSRTHPIHLAGSGRRRLTSCVRATTVPVRRRMIGMAGITYSLGVRAVSCVANVACASALLGGHEGSPYGRPATIYLSSKCGGHDMRDSATFTRRLFVCDLQVMALRLV